MNIEKILEAIERAIVTKAPDCIAVDYKDRIEINSIVKTAFLSIDRDKVLALITEKLEEEIATKVVNKMLTELGTDIKSIMSNQSYREDLKFHLRKTVDRICSRVTEGETNETTNIKLTTD